MNELLNTFIKFNQFTSCVVVESLPSYFFFFFVVALLWLIHTFICIYWQLTMCFAATGSKVRTASKPGSVMQVWSRYLTLGSKHNILVGTWCFKAVIAHLFNTVVECRIHNTACPCKTQCFFPASLIRLVGRQALSLPVTTAVTTLGYFPTWCFFSKRIGKVVDLQQKSALSQKHS